MSLRVNRYCGNVNAACHSRESEIRIKIGGKGSRCQKLFFFFCKSADGQIADVSFQFGAGGVDMTESDCCARSRRRDALEG